MKGTMNMKKSISGVLHVDGCLYLHADPALPQRKQTKIHSDEDRKKQIKSITKQYFNI